MDLRTKVFFECLVIDEVSPEKEIWNKIVFAEYLENEKNDLASNLHLSSNIFKVIISREQD
jgi:hypothetical protein